jgi:hypothetical protein
MTEQWQPPGGGPEQRAGHRRPDSPELRAELAQLAAFRRVTFGDDEIGETICTHLVMAAGWPDPDARAYAAQITAEAISWPAGQLLDYFRAYQQASRERARLNGAAKHYVPGMNLPQHLEFMRPQLESGFDSDVAAKARSRAVDEQARRQLDAQGWQPPEATGSLADGLTRPRTGEAHRIPGYAGMNHNVLLAGPRKTGKTQLLANLASSLSLTSTAWDERIGAWVWQPAPFLGRSQCWLAGNVACVNLEMDEQDWLDVFRAMPGWACNAARIFPLHRRGLPLPVITSAAAREWFVAWLREHQTEVLIIDTWGQFCARNGVRRMNDDGEVLPVLAGLDEIKTAAGVASLYLSIHMPHQTGDKHLERFKGAGAVGDWADVLWTFITEEKEGKEVRYLGAVGRSRIDAAESALDFDAATGLLSWGEGGTRKQAKARGQAARIRGALEVAGAEGMLTEELVGAAGGHLPDARDTLREMLADGEIEMVPQGRGKRYFLHGLSDQEGAGGQ